MGGATRWLAVAATVIVVLGVLTSLTPWQGTSRPAEAVAAASAPASAAVASATTVTPRLVAEQPPPTVPALEVVVREVLPAPDGSCYAGERRTVEHRVTAGREVVLAAGLRRCRLETATLRATADRGYLVGRGGVTMPPQDLGPNGSLTSALGRDPEMLIVGFAPLGASAADDGAAWPRVSIRFE